MVPTLLILVASAAAATATAWPPFLPPPERFSAVVIDSIERVWRAPTLTRSVEAEPVHVERAVYLAFVDAPDVTAAAARHLGLARYDVEVIGPDWYRADDHAGARGVYRVLLRDGDRRVILSWGSHAGRVLGTIRGHALSVMDFAARDHTTVPHLTAYVLIENPVAARLASVLAPLFGGLIDRKLTDGFRVTARVAEWAVADHEAFCAWLASTPFDFALGDRRACPRARPHLTRRVVRAGTIARAT